MKRTVQLIMVLAGVTLCSCVAHAQEQLLPLRFNTSLFNHQQPVATTRSAVTLPFIDDFSYPGPDPDPLLWENNGAFLNLTFAKDPITYGVVSLDGLDGNGIPYDTLSHSFSSIDSADVITSVPVLLGAVTAADSVYFSFFYQPGGMGDIPNTQAFNLFNYGKAVGDSLVLEFKNSTGQWQHAWAHDGSSVQPFKQVMIAIIQPQFFHDDFQFRFRNYASIIGNYDQWHLDYIRLNSGRNKFDTLISDVAIQLYPTSLLKTYQAMPWKQFQNYQEEEKALNHQLVVKNNFNVVKNTSYHFDATEKLSSSPVFVSNVQSQNISASDTAQVLFGAFEIPDFFQDTVIISTRYIVGATGDNNTRNDTIIRDQVFSNYMAYDDGTAEATYRLLGSPASLAQRYIVNEPDTLQGIAIHFSNTDEDMGQNLFSLIVWSSLNDGDTLYRDDFLKPGFIDELNGFVFYRLSHTVIVTDTFYIGFQQTSITSDIKTDIGFDLNTDGSDHLFYNLNATWFNSEFNGSLMMRPVMGKSIPFQVGIDEPANAAIELLIYPNPVHDVLMLQYENGTGYQCEILDNTGRVLQQVTGEKSIVVSDLAPGFYLLRVTNPANGKTAIQKFIKQ
ncbi:MAG TPA: T9SS type A sorting domain-containing protein [Chitinophagales bacterium]|nr:T9SS type A sorting domain-containing protein [Chitinophagales bacterium]